MTNHQRQLRRAYFRALRTYRRTKARADRLRLTIAFLALLRAGGRVAFETAEQRENRIIAKAMQKGRKSA